MFDVNILLIAALQTLVTSLQLSFVIHFRVIFSSLILLFIFVITSTFVMTTFVITTFVITTLMLF